MIQDSAQICRQGAQDFRAYYEYACARQDSIPLPAVGMHLAKGILDFSGDRVKLTDWPPILGSISINRRLHHIAVSSAYQAGLVTGDPDTKYYRSSYKRMIPALRSKDMTLKLCKALRDCLTVSPNLKTLQLSGLPLRERDLIILTKGLAKSVSLENLSLAYCPIADEGLEAICQSVKYSSSIKTVDFTGCNLTWRGAEHMANIIKHQGTRRHGAAWAESLRYRQPEFDGMGGLRRVTLNCNTLIGDRGAAALAHELAEDLWVKAVDLQKCGMSNEGARSLLEALKTNSCLCVLDIRSNPLVDKVLVKTIIEKVLMNADGQSSQYDWIKPPAPREPQKLAGAKRRALATAVRGRATLRIAPRRGTSAGRRSPGVAQQQRPRPNSKHIPWRTAARAGRQRGLPPGMTVAEPSFQGAAIVKVTMETDSEEEEEEEEDEEKEGEVVEVEKSPSALSRKEFQRMQVVLEDCRLRFAEERRARLKAESRLTECELENARLRSLNLSLSEALVAPVPSGLEDEAVLESIEASFNKFHAFLDLLKDAGLGQLASLAGIDQSDFSPLGRPQLSSTIGQPPGGTASVTGSREGRQDTREKIDVASSVADPSGAPADSPAPPGTPKAFSPVPPGTPKAFSPAPPAAPRAFSPAPPAAPRAFLLEDRPRVPSLEEDEPGEVALLQASVPGGDANMDPESGEDEPDRDSQPEGCRPQSGSERSFRSHRSQGDGSRSNRSSHRDLSQPSQHGNSHHSNGSHGYSFNYSNIHSSIRSDGSRGDLSARSSLSDLVSDKAESVGSSGSKGRGGRRVPTGGHSGTEGWGVKAYPGPEALERVRSVSSLGGQSDDGSF